MNFSQHIAWAAVCLALSLLGAFSLGASGALLLMLPMLGIEIFCDYATSEGLWAVAIYFGIWWPAILFVSLYLFRLLKLHESRRGYGKAKKVAAYAFLLYVPSIALAWWQIVYFTPRHLTCW